MKLGEAKLDLKKLEEGDWVDNIPEMDGLRLKTRGANNNDWRKLSTRLINATPRNRRVNGLDPADQDRINCVLLRDTALLDWEGPEAEDGSPLPFSKAQAYEYLKNPATKFLDAALWAASVVAEQTQAAVEGDAKN